MFFSDDPEGKSSKLMKIKQAELPNKKVIGFFYWDDFN